MKYAAQITERSHHFHTINLRIEKVVVTILNEPHIHHIICTAKLLQLSVKLNQLTNYSIYM